MNIEIVQIILKVDGEPKLVRIPFGREHLVLGLLQAVFDDGRIAVKSLPPGFSLIPVQTEQSPA
jgi:hypothetical protein